MNLEKLEQVIVKLSGINTPIGLIPAVGIPLFNATEELKEIYAQALEEANKSDLKVVKEESEDVEERVPATEQ